MGRWRIPVACALAAAAAPEVSVAMTLDEVVGIFRQSCLEQLPDLSGSEAEFRRLGFVGESILQKYDPDSFSIASVMVGGFYGASVCSMEGQLPAGSPIAEAVESAIRASTTADVVRSDEQSREGPATAFEWEAGSLPVMVGAAERNNGLFYIVLFVGELPQ